jgi:hypothetical protein
MVLLNFWNLVLSLIPFWRAALALILEHYDIKENKKTITKPFLNESAYLNGPDGKAVCLEQ